MDLFIQLLIGIIPAIVTGLVAYFTAKRKAETELEKVEKESEGRIKELKETLEVELKKVEKESQSRINELKEKVNADLEVYEGKLNADAVNDLSMKAIQGDFDFGKLGEAMEQISKFEEQFKNM
ncbi:hypothetical protein [Staphylococcus equorum]|uniref:hypothetical protein n=1 Tax=Staphylococcus equorum TaxID=246432 RepID=UPI0018687B9F|nr:hypothetical protein [Staphylococcus equorum]